MESEFNRRKEDNRGAFEKLISDNLWQVITSAIFALFYFGFWWAGNKEVKQNVDTTIAVQSTIKNDIVDLQKDNLLTKQCVNDIKENIRNIVQSQEKLNEKFDNLNRTLITRNMR